MEETALDSRFARMSYDNHTPGVSNLTLSPSQKFCLGIGSKLLDCSAWVIQRRSTRCFLATWVTFEVQSVFGDVKLDLSLATSVPKTTEASSDLWGSTLIIERVYLF
jgi:FPC/CPF motif-containing protein YcgG